VSVTRKEKMSTELPDIPFLSPKVAILGSCSPCLDGDFNLGKVKHACLNSLLALKMPMGLSSDESELFCPKRLEVFTMFTHSC
jgi:hypothetical protein